MQSHMAQEATQGSISGGVRSDDDLLQQPQQRPPVSKDPVFHTQTKNIEVHYHFVHERVLSGEVELFYVHTDGQTVDIFTKPLGLDKLRLFSNALALQHLNIPNLRGRNSERSGRDRSDELNDEFFFKTVEEAEDRYEGSNQRNDPQPEATG